MQDHTKVTENIDVPIAPSSYPGSLFCLSSLALNGSSRRTLHLLSHGTFFQSSCSLGPRLYMTTLYLTRSQEDNPGGILAIKMKRCGRMAQEDHILWECNDLLNAIVTDLVLIIDEKLHSR